MKSAQKDEAGTGSVWCGGWSPNLHSSGLLYLVTVSPFVVYITFKS